MNKLAQIKLYDGGGFTGFGTLGLQNGGSAPSIFARLVSTSIGIITIVSIVWFLFIFASGALSIITSNGEKGAVEASKKKITSGIIGLSISVLGLVIARLIGSLLGLDILNFGSMFSQLKI